LGDIRDQVAEIEAQLGAIAAELELRTRG